MSQYANSVRKKKNKQSILFKRLLLLSLFYIASEERSKPLCSDSEMSYVFRWQRFTYAKAESRIKTE